ncbi:HPP family protein [Candidatus Woesearchaeota archaeon]|nr:HPP family protein [Candidatus Woesearchaeota archaeon]
MAKKEKEVRVLWHKYFFPALIAGLGVAIVAYFFELNSANLLMFASVGASAVTISHKYRHHLTTLRTTILAYIAGCIISLFIGAIGVNIGLSIPVQVFFVVALVSFAILYFNIFHPPAVSASISFIIFHRNPSDLVFLLASIIILFIVIRFFIYVWYEHLSIKDFIHEFTHLKMHNK